MIYQIFLFVKKESKKVSDALNYSVWELIKHILQIFYSQVFFYK